MDVRDLTLRHYDCQVTIKPNSGNPLTWTEALVSFVKANDLLHLQITQSCGQEVKAFQLTKNIKSCFSWADTSANRVTLRTMNPNVKFTLNFQTKEAETVVGGFLKKIQYNQEHEDAQAVNALTTISAYPKKRKAVTYASKPPLQKKSLTAFSYAPLNNFDEINESSIPTAKSSNPAARQEATKPLATIDNINEPRKDAPHTAKPLIPAARQEATKPLAAIDNINEPRKGPPHTAKLTVQKKISSSFAPINNFDNIEENPKHTSASSERDALSSLDNNVRRNSRVLSRSPIPSEDRSTDICVSPPRHQRSPSKINQTSSQGSNPGGSPVRNGKKQRSPTSSPRSSSGLSNLGNTCYVNSILQSLLSLKSFCRALLDVHVESQDKIEGTLYQSLTKILRLRISHPNEMIEQDDLQTCIARTSERFTKHQQEDSHEYLSMCLNKLHNDTVEVSQELDDSCYEKDGKCCPVDEHFQCRVTSTLSCTQCSWSSTHFEVFRDLSLNLPDSSEWQCSDPIGVDIPTLLFQYFMDEKVSYKCEECQCTEAIVRKKINRPPRTLVLHLKRFTKDMYDDVCRKRNDCIQVRPTLNLGPWCTDEVNIPERSIPSEPESDSDLDQDNEQQGEPEVHTYLASNETKENGLRPLAELQRLAAAEYQRSRGVRVEYKLQSVVSHHGGTIKRGHFVCDVRQEDGWVCYNDSVSSHLGSVQGMAEKRKKDAYLLFYQLN
ncbi:hypothetical protein K450DRAFT_262072 [Umbelopsis ramanniana AG]|uniref:Ubiquitin carboxyl-terminal hydrolase n=1 Tax=Umbelopsis ramanniana AG TaxID=1314678 RepID=A0AAD5E2V7_UMBRA|nr:uncharacterized protein K450DRAFT_262072 [Umbelopsis ramanniana AG]KAI8575405.1 hypothetical protein K450DRAFT_262072 [Umbelopsis ramanniana AG]